MKTAHKLIIALPLLTTLSGCVIAFGDFDDKSKLVQSEEKQMRSSIENLQMGVAYADAREKLGEPNFIEAFASGGADYKVLFYRTQRTKADGDTTRDETTPVVFRDGKLIGYGQKLYDAIKV